MRRKFQTGNVAAISVSHLFHDVYSAFFAPMLPILIRSLGIPVSMIGVLDFTRKAPSLLNPLVGIAADRICGKYFVILTPAITAAAMSLTGLSPSVGILILFLFTAGLSSTFFHVPAPVMIRQLSGDRIGTGMSFYMLGGELSRTLGPLIVTGAISLWGVDGTWRLMPFGIASSAVLYFKIKKIKITRDQGKVKKVSEYNDSIRQLYPMFISVALFLFFRTAMKSALTLYLPTYLTFKGETLWSANLSLSVLQLAGAAGTLLAGFISDRIGRKNTLMISSLISPVLMWMFLSSDSFLSLPLLGAIGFFLFAPGPVLLAIVQDNRSSSPSFINSIYMTVSFAVSSLIIYLVGLAVDLTDFDFTYRVSVLMAVLSVPVIFFIPEKTVNIN